MGNGRLMNDNHSGENQRNERECTASDLIKTVWDPRVLATKSVPILVKMVREDQPCQSEGEEKRKAVDAVESELSLLEFPETEETDVIGGQGIAQATVPVVFGYRDCCVSGRLTTEHTVDALDPQRQIFHVKVRNE